MYSGPNRRLGPRVASIETDLTTVIDRIETEGLQGPTGAIIAYRFASTPAGWLALDGATKNYNDYPALGALYGASPGGTFVLDDYRALPLWGSSGGTLGATTGADTVDISHTHAVSATSSSDGDHNHGGATGTPSATVTPLTLALGSAGSGDHTHSISTSGAHTHTVSATSASGATTSLDLRPARALVRWLIKT